MKYLIVGLLLMLPQLAASEIQGFPYKKGDTLYAQVICETAKDAEVFASAEMGTQVPRCLELPFPVQAKILEFTKVYMGKLIPKPPFENYVAVVIKFKFLGENEGYAIWVSDLGIQV